MSDNNAIGRVQTRINTYNEQINTMMRKRDILRESIAKAYENDMKKALLLTDEMRGIEKEITELTNKIKTLRNACSQAKSIDSTVETQQHLDDLNFSMTQSMNAIGINRVRGINQDSERIADDAKQFLLYTMPDPEQEERENEENRLYLENLMRQSSPTVNTNSNKVSSPTSSSSSTGTGVQKRSALSELDSFMSGLK